MGKDNGHVSNLLTFNLEDQIVNYLGFYINWTDE